MARKSSKFKVGDRVRRNPKWWRKEAPFQYGTVAEVRSDGAYMVQFEGRPPKVTSRYTAEELVRAEQPS